MLPDPEAAALINEMQVHVLINLVGHTAGARHLVTQWRTAPVQAMHYGYPGTSALPAMDYMQLDVAAAPPAHRRDFSERFAYFPHSHFIAAHTARYPSVPTATRDAQPWNAHGNARRRVAASDGEDATRRDLGLGLPDSRLDGFAMVNFNQLYKMDAGTYTAWMNALRRLPGGFLWLSRVTVRKDSSFYAEANLLQEAAASGMHTGRIALSWRFPEQDYVAFRALGDLMVDNRNYNAHTTGADALWAGVPMVALEARHLAGRASSSFARALGVASVVTVSMRAYEDVVLDLGVSRQRLWHLRRRLLHMRDHAPFFDLDLLAQDQERVARGMLAVFDAGLAPMHVLAARSA